MQTNCTTENKIHLDQMLRLWDISIYVRLLAGNKSKKIQSFRKMKALFIGHKID